MFMQQMIVFPRWWWRIYSYRLWNLARVETEWQTANVTLLLAPRSSYLGRRVDLGGLLGLVLKSGISPMYVETAVSTCGVVKR